jgi:Coenzyme PQQ synthesis protein D (PqqD)
VWEGVAVGADADRPRRVAGAGVTELPGGLLVRPPGRAPVSAPAQAQAHQLNNTASVILELCDGQRTVTQIAAALAGAFGLDAVPLAEVTTCIAGLRRAGILAESSAERPKGHAGNPFDYFDAIYCLNLDQRPDRWGAARRRFSVLDIATRVERFPAISTPRNHHVGCAQSWRLMVATARDCGLGNFLGIEDDAIFLDETLPVLRQAVAELEGLPWDLLYLGGATWGRPADIPGHTALQAPEGLTCTHALAVSQSAYDRLLAEIPTADGIDEWITTHRAIDQYLSKRVNACFYRAYVLNPRVATQAELTGLAGLDGPLRDRYTIR